MLSGHRLRFIDDEQWKHIERPATDLVARYIGKESKSLKNYDFDSFVRHTFNVTAFAMWLCLIYGLEPLDEDLVLHPSVIEGVRIEPQSFVVGGGSAAVNVLQRIRTVLFGERPYKPTSEERLQTWLKRAVYEPGDFEWLREFCFRSGRQATVNATAIVCLGIGAGLSARDMALIRRADIGQGSRSLTVTVTRVRGTVSIPISQPWSDMLKDCLELNLRTADQWLIVPNSAPERIERVIFSNLQALNSHPSAPGKVTIERLRTTWVLALLKTGVPKWKIEELADPVLVRRCQGLLHAVGVDPVSERALEALLCGVTSGCSESLFVNFAGELPGVRS